jgi:hypothetical protein
MVSDPEVFNKSDWKLALKFDRQELRAWTRRRLEAIMTSSPWNNSENSPKVIIRSWGLSLGLMISGYWGLRVFVS